MKLTQKFKVTISFFLMSLLIATPTISQSRKAEQFTARGSAVKGVESEALLDMGSGAIPVLQEGLESSDRSIQVKSILLLGELGAKEAVPELINHMRRADDLRSAIVAMYALGNIGDNRATPILLSTASSVKNDPNRRRSAIVALGLLGDQKAIPILENILDDDIEILRIFAAGSLGLLGNEQGLDIALKGTKSADPSIRMHAIQAIGLIGSDSALGTLNEMLLMSPPMVERQTIELAIYQIELKMLPVEAKISNIEGKIMSISKRSAMSRWCVNELRRIGGSRAAASLQEIVERHPDPQVRRWANRKKKALDISETMKGQNADEPQ